MPTPRILLPLLPLLSLSLLACSPSAQDEPIVPNPDTPPTSIAFSSSNNKWQEAATKAATSGLESLFKSFRTWGYKTTANIADPSSLQIVMDGYKMAYTSGSAGNTVTNTADWEYAGIANPILAAPQTIKYWDYSATSYRFFAYAPFTTDVKTTVATAASSATATLSFPFEYSDAATATSTPYTSHLWLATPLSTATSSGNTTANIADPSSLQIVMDGYKMAYTSGSAGNTVTNTADWEYAGIANPILAAPQTIKYWDYSATSYRFFAYAPFTTDVKTTVATAASSATATLSFPFEYSDAATATSTPYTSHLWLATPLSTATSSGNTTTPAAAYGSCVTLTFAPIIAKVRFRFTYPNGTKRVSISNIRFCDSRFAADPTTADTPLRGTIAATYPLTGLPTATAPSLAMTPAQDAATGFLLLSVPYEDASDALHVVKDPTLYRKWYYVPPFANIPYEQGPYTISVSVSGKKVEATVPAQYMQWKAGYQYTYIFKLSDVGDNISFSDLQVEQWLPAPEIKNEGAGTEDW